MTKIQRMYNGLYVFRKVCRKDPDSDEDGTITDYYLSDDPLLISFKAKVSIKDYVGHKAKYDLGKILKPKKQIEDLRDALEALPWVKGAD